MTPMPRAMALAGVALLSLAACNAAPTLRPPGSPVPFVLVTPVNGPQTTTVTLTDRSGLVDGVTSVDPTTLGLSAGDWDKLNEKGYVVMGITGSNDIALLWRSGVCYPQQTVAISGAPKHLNIDIQLIPPTGDGACEAVGGGPSVRLAMAAPVDLLGVAVTVAFMRPVPAATSSPTSSATAYPPVRVFNQTSIPVTLFVNGTNATVIPPESLADPVLGAFPARPWEIQIQSESGRPLLYVDVPAGDLGGGIRKVGEVSCGLIEVAVAGQLPISEPAFTLPIPGVSPCD